MIIFKRVVTYFKNWKNFWFLLFPNFEGMKREFKQDFINEKLKKLASCESQEPKNVN